MSCCRNFVWSSFSFFFFFNFTISKNNQALAKFIYMYKRISSTRRQLFRQNPESTEGCSKWILRKNLRQVREKDRSEQLEWSVTFIRWRVDIINFKTSYKKFNSYIIECSSLGCYLDIFENIRYHILIVLGEVLSKYVSSKRHTNSSFRNPTITEKTPSDDICTQGPMKWIPK